MASCAQTWQRTGICHKKTCNQLTLFGELFASCRKSLGVCCASFVLLGMNCGEMCATHAEECRWGTVYCVAGLLVVVALVQVRINRDLCWSSLSLSLSLSSLLPLISISLFILCLLPFSMFFFFFLCASLFLLSPFLHLFSLLAGRGKRKNHAFTLGIRTEKKMKSRLGPQ